jgi:hypothetical protein
MKRILTSSLALLILTSISFAGVVISKFEAEAGHNKVILKWTTTAESDLKGFEIERSFDNKYFQNIGFVEGAGNSSTPRDYTFEDKSIFKSLTTTFYYKLKIVDKDGSYTYYDKVLTIIPQVSSARHTWGSIKAMFR